MSPHPILRLPPRALAAAFVVLLTAFSPRALPADLPVTTDASPEAGALLAFLHTLRGKYILSGQQEFPGWPDTIEIGQASDPDFKRIVEVTGRMPAVRGFDLLFYTHSAAGRATQRSTERAIAWWQQGGLVACCVHLFMDIGSPAGSPQFYVPGANGNSPGTTFDISRAVIDGTPENTELLAKFDVIAAELKTLRDAGVPVIWRPFHECSGGWFWWGAKGPAPFKAAYRLMFERFTQLHGLNNLIWVYNPAGANTLDAWYPGDDVVDMISLDAYPPAGTHPSYAAEYRQLDGYRGGRKAVAMTENGPIPDPDALFADGAYWSYFCTWNGSFIQDEAVNSAAFLQRVFNHPRVLTRDELDGILPRTGIAPAIVIAPQATTAGTGANVTLAVVAHGSAPLTYQWRRDGVDIPAATQPAVTLPDATTADSGSYAVTISNAAGSVATPSVAVTITPEPFAARPTALTNISTRARVGTGDHILIPGFVIGGTSAKRVLIRAVGPTLGAATEDGGYAVPGSLADPEFVLTKPDGTVVASNDDWGAGTDPLELEEAFARSGAFPLLPGSRDAALTVALPPGQYTALVRGVAEQTGITLVEIYDLDTHSPARLVNLSTRGDVGQGDDVMIAGFVTEGAGTTDLLLRAVGPGLAAHMDGWLPDPRIDIAPAAGLATPSNDDWGAAPNLAALAQFSAGVGAFGLPAGSKDAALFQAVAPGVRTAIISAPDSSTPAIALAEVYVTP